MNAEPVEVSMIDLAGMEELLKNKSDKLRLINFWATWCLPCIEEFPELIEINRNFRKRSFEMVTVSMDVPAKNEAVLKFLKKSYASTTNFHFSSDDKYALIDAVDKDWPGSLPYTIIVEPGGNILYKKLGVIDPSEVRKIIVEYLGRYWEHLQ
jgi:thiol-disulfide isomerase/thioredoxin